MVMAAVTVAMYAIAASHLAITFLQLLEAIARSPKSDDPGLPVNAAQIYIEGINVSGSKPGCSAVSNCSPPISVSHRGLHCHMESVGGLGAQLAHVRFTRLSPPRSHRSDNRQVDATQGKS
jgi:hypothetical protein